MKSKVNNANKNRKSALIIALTVLSVVILVSGIIFFCVLKQENTAEKERERMLEVLEEDSGEYDERTIVLQSTNRETAEMLAEKLNATLRITTNGEYATLTLPEGVSLNDVYSDDTNLPYLERFSLDYSCSIAGDVAGENTEGRYAAPRYTVSDSLYSEQTYLNYLNLSDVWNTTKGSGVVVAVIDTGIDTDHPEFSGKISPLSYNASEDKIVKDYSDGDGFDWSLIEDEVGHGTSVAGVISAAMDGSGTVGIAPEATLVVIKAECSGDGTFARTSDLVFGLYYAIECGADVVNMSFGCYETTNPFADATRLAVDDDIICIASAGNDSTSVLSWPAADENVIGVGAFAENSWELASYSNFGDNSDVVAPGTVYTCQKGGGYGYSTGTSLSAPAVTAVAALYCSINRSVEYLPFREVLFAATFDLGDPGEDYYYGFGAMDVSSFVLESKGTVTFDYLTDEIESTTQVFVREHTLQDIPDPERLYSVFDGWYYDPQYTEELNLYEDVFSADLTLYAKWVNEDDGVPFNYRELKDGTIEILSYKGHRRYITIPDYIEGKKVTVIGEGAFKDETELRIVNLPKFLVTIEQYAFANCSNLLSTEIPDATVTIGYMAFAECPRMSAVIFGSNSSLETIGEWAFAGCGNIRSFTLPASVKSVNASAFYMNASLKSMAVAPGSSYFSTYDGILLNVTRSQVVFCPMGKTGSVKLPDSVIQINELAFVNSKLTSVDLNKTESILKIAFYGAKIQTLVLPDTLTYISDGDGYDPYFNDVFGVFQSCTGLKSVYVGSGLDKVASFAFCSDTLLTEVTFSENEKIKCIDAYAFSSTGLTGIKFPAKLEEIGSYAFEFTPLAAADFPQTLETIGAYAFLSCESLGRVTFADDSALVLIDEAAFAHCIALNEIALPDRLQAIGALAFAYTGLGKVTLPASLIDLGMGAFAYCRSLSDIYVKSGNTVYCDLNGVVYSLDKTVIVEYPSGNSRTDYAVENGVKTVGEGAFMGTYGVKKVTLPDSVLLIDESAFESSADLTDVIMGDSVTDIKDYAFMGDSSLKYVKLSLGLKNIESRAFSGCTVLETPDLPEGLIHVGEYAFEYTYSFWNVNIPSTLTALERYSFAGCGARSYNLPSTLTEIAEGAVSDNKNLTSISIPEKVSLISRYAFSGNYNMITVRFAENCAITRLGYASLANCGITSLTVPKSVSSIAQGAFEDCTSLYNVTFAVNSSLEYISAYMFDGCSNLREITFREGSKLTRIEAHGLEGMRSLRSIDFGNAQLTEIGNYAFRFCESLLTLNIPDSVTEIGRYAFYSCYNLETLTLPSSLEEIGRFAFLGDEKLTLYFSSKTLPAYLQEDWEYGIKGYYLGVSEIKTSGDWQYLVTDDGSVSIVEYTGSATEIDLTAIDFGGPVTTIGGNVFAYSTLTRIVLPQTLKTIAASAFYKSNLAEITIPESVTFIGQYAFADTPIESLTFSGTPQIYTIEKYAFENTSKLQAAVLPASLTSLGRGVFRSSGIKSLTFADGFSMDEIPELAFAYTQLETVTIPESVETIGSGAFRNTEKLTSVTLPTVRELMIRDNAFYMSGLTQVYIPENVTYIGEYAFIALQSLQEYTVSENNLYYKSVDGLLMDKDGRKLIAVPAGRTGTLIVPSTVETIGFGAMERSAMSEVIFDSASNILTFGYRAFFAMDSLREITVPSSVVSIDFYAFAYCQSLQKVTFAEGSRLTGVYEGAFYGCRSLSDITLPDSIVEISDFAFYDCSLLTSLPVSSTDNLRGIYSYAMAYTGITELTVPASIADIGDYAFLGTPLTSVKFETENDSEYDLVIGFGAFDGCEELTEITVPFVGSSFEDGKNTWFGYIFGAGSYSSNATYVPQSLRRVTISSDITFLGDGAFYGLSMLTEIDFPETVVKTENNSLTDVSALYNLPNLRIDGEINETYSIIDCVLTVYDGVTKISDINLSGKQISEIILPESLEEIGENCFYGALCGEITLPKSLKKLSTTAFTNSNIKVVNNESSLEITFGGAFSEAYLIINSDGTTVVNDSNEIYGPSYSYHVNSAFVYSDSEKRILQVEFSQGGTKLYILNPQIDDGTYTLECGYELFSYAGINTLIIGEGTEKIYDSQFCNNRLEIGIPCSNVILPEGLKEIGANAFQNSDIKEIYIPDSVNKIGRYAFMNCTELSYVKLPYGIKETGDLWFWYCSNLHYIEIPESVEKIGATFSWSGLIEITIPESVTEIGSAAFENCKNLVHVTLGSNVSTIPASAFTLCENLKTLTLPYTNNHFTIKDGLLYNYDMSKLICFIGDVPSNLIIPDTVTEISSGAFGENEQIESIYIPDSVKQIGAGAFSCCSGLTEIRLPEGMTAIPDGCFCECYALSNINIPSAVTTIGENAFSDCNLDTLILPESVVTIARSAFSSASITSLYISSAISVNDYSFTYSKIENIYVDSFEHWMSFAGNWIQLDGYTTTPAYKNIFINGEKVTDLVIPEGTVSVSDKAFYGLDSLTSLHISASLSSIGNRTFANCTNLNTLTVDSNNPYFTAVDNILYNKDMTEIVFVPAGLCGDITIPYGVTAILDYAFSNVEGITSVKLPDTVTSIGNYAFSNCTSLKAVELPASLLSIGEFAFYGCKLFEEITIPDSVESVGAHAFYQCSGLKRAILGSKMGTVPYMMFAFCDSLEYIIIPEGITSIGCQAFIDCHPNTLVLPSTLKTLEWHAFQGITVDTLVIPEGITEIPMCAFYECNIRKLVLPDSVETLAGDAFYHATVRELTLGKGLKEVPQGGYTTIFSGYSACKYIINRSSLNITCGSSEYRGLAENAVVIQESDGTYSYSSDAIVLSNGLVFVKTDSGIEYVAYTETDAAVTLPADVNGSDYIMYSITGVNEVSFAEGTLKLTENMLAGLTGVNTLKIPASVTSIDVNGLAGMTSLENIIVAAENQNFTADNGILYTYGYQKVVYICTTNNGELILPEGVTEMPGFASGSSIVSITIPSSLTGLSQSSFSGLTNLLEIKLTGENNPYAVENGILYTANYDAIIYIPEQYSGTLDIHEGVTKLDCIYNYGIDSIVIPASLTSISNDMRYYYPNLKSITVSPDNPVISYIDGFLYQNNTILTFIYDGSTTVRIKDGVTNVITDYYSVGDENVCEFIFPESVVNISIYNAGNLEKLNLPVYLENLGINSLTNIDTLVLPESLKYLHISGAAKLKELHIPDTVLTVELSECNALTSVCIPGNVTSFKVEYCSALKSVVLSEGITSIGTYAFYGDYALADISLPDSLSYISSWAFKQTKYEEKYEIADDGAKYLGKILVSAPASAEYFIPREGTKWIMPNAYKSCKKLKVAEVSSGCDLSNCANIETLILRDVTGYVSCSASTLKNIIIRKVSRIGDLNTSLFQNFSGINIFVEQDEKDVRWDENFPGWSGNNHVYYGDKWIAATFYDTDGSILSYWPYLSSQVIRQPHIGETFDRQYTYRFVGWDTDGDGEADVVPATSDVDIYASPVFEKVLNSYTVTFYGKDGEVIQQQTLPYGSAYTLITAPEYTGYTFIGWSGYSENLTVGGRVEITGEWQHSGDGHSYTQTETVAATCSEQGYIKHICSICNEWYADEYTDCLQHNYVSQVISADCTHEGYTLYTCSMCENTYRENETPMLSHQYGDTVVDSEPTCTDAGSGHHICIKCGATENVTIDPINHNCETVEKVESTCTSAGHITYRCTRCSTEFTEELPLANHSYESCRFEKSALESLLSSVKNLKYTEIGDEIIIRKCSVCGHIETESSSGAGVASIQSVPCPHTSSHTENIYTVKLGSYYTLTATRCDNCDKILGLTLVPSKCNGNDGKEHVEGEWIIDKNPTCTECGTRHKECTACGDTLVTEEISALDHDFQWVIDKNATFDSTGLKHEKCSRCEETRNLNTVIPILICDHNLVETKKVSATCLEKGREAYWTCTECGKMYSDPNGSTQITDLTTLDIKALGHSFTNYISDGNAQCLTDGTKTAKCDRCDETDTKTDVGSALDHDFQWITDKPATVLETGLKHEKCTRCEETRNMNTIIPILDCQHNLVETKKVSATCLEKGREAYWTCTECGKMYSDPNGSTQITDLTTLDIKALGHSFTNYISDGNAQCLIDGTKTAKCDRCDETDTITDVGSALDHDFQWITDKPATVLETGLKHEKCTRCEETRNLNTVIPILEYASKVSLSNSTVTTAWGLDFTTTVYATQLDGEGAQFTLVYDADIVKYKSHIAAEGVTVTVDEASHTITVSSTDALSTDEATELVTITFTTSDELASGDYEFLALSADDAQNTAAFVGFTIYEIGDVNMDGKVNSRDVTLIKQSAVRMITLTDVQKAYADAYVDGNVNSRDATIITQYVVHMDVTLGDRVTVTFTDAVSKAGETETVKRSVHKGNTLTAAPEAAEGYAWSSSETEYVIPDFTWITSERKYYLVKKNS